MEYDNENYWIARHKNYVDDVRSVGNMAKDVFANLAGYEKKVRMLRDALLRGGADAIENLRILEIGCGVGMMATDLINGGANYTGLDISPVAVEQAQKRAPAGKFICSNAYDYSLHQEFDVVFCTDVLVHLIKDENWIRALEGMKRHVKRDGFIIIKEVIYEDRRSPSPHVVSRSLSEYLNACKELELDLRSIDGVPGFYLLKVTHGNSQI
jgi:2-polyprenyl-3-methyl-5-hydroxy-6-metoxy-1,4-benzoquinol methylase